MTNQLKITVYEHNNFGGKKLELPIGKYNFKTIRKKIGNDIISSVQIPNGLQVTLYEHANFKGRTKLLKANTSSLPDFNDITSAILVEPSEGFTDQEIVDKTNDILNGFGISLNF